MMQRMTSYGIKSWDELNGVVANPTVVEMKTSYRQSQKLLEVARQLYMDTLGETPNYKAFMKSNKVPTPLVYVDDNEHVKIEWISKRISEVFRAYGEQLPSIAIFVTDKGDDTMMAALDAGAEDVVTNDDCYEVITKPENLHAVRKAFEDGGYDAYIKNSVTGNGKDYFNRVNDNNYYYNSK